MGAKYVPSIKDLKAIQRFQEKQKRERQAQAKAKRAAVGPKSLPPAQKSGEAKDA